MALEPPALGANGIRINGWGTTVLSCLGAVANSPAFVGNISSESRFRAGPWPGTVLPTSPQPKAGPCFFRKLDRTAACRFYLGFRFQPPMNLSCSYRSL